MDSQVTNEVDINTEFRCILTDWKRGTSEAMYELTITFHVAFEELGF
jgi:hypothetical protein